MRLSASPRPGFKTKPVPMGYRVMMDGRPLERVLRVDTGAGVAWVAEVDAQGHLVIDHKRHEVVERRVFGPMRLVPITEAGEQGNG